MNQSDKNKIMTYQPLQFGQYYHIYNRGNNRENLFVQPRNYPYFMQLYTKHILPVAETFAYCLMPNHYHLLVRSPLGNLSSAMKHLGATYTQSFNRRHRRDVEGGRQLSVDRAAGRYQALRLGGTRT